MVNNAADYKEDVSKPSFVSQKMFSKNFSPIPEIKPVLRLEKTIYIEFCILNLNTWCMNSITNTLRVNLMLNCCLFRSSCYEAETDDVYEDFYGDKHLFDFSDYLENWKFLIHLMQTLLVKWKMNSKEKIISETVGLKPKIYSLIDGDSKENKKVKRVNKNVAKNIWHKEFFV